MLALAEVLLQQAETHKNVLLPGYTHFQAAMPSSFGLWFGAYAEHLLLDLDLPSSYHRDFQILKEILFEPLGQLLDILDLLIFALPQPRVKPDLLSQPKYDAVFTVENINELIQQGVPFRTAYQQVGQAVNDGSYVPQREFQTSHMGSIHNPRLAEIAAKLATGHRRWPS